MLILVGSVLGSGASLMLIPSGKTELIQTVDMIISATDIDNTYFYSVKFVCPNSILLSYIQIITAVGYRAVACVSSLIAATVNNESTQSANSWCSVMVL